MILRTDKSFTRRNWTRDRLKVASAPKGQKTTAQKELAANVRRQLEIEAERKRRAAQ